MNTRAAPRRPWAGIILGLLLGIVAGGYYAWFVDPVTYENVSPNYLSEQAKADYALLISQSFVIDSNLQRAQTRLATLGVNDSAQYVTELADEAFLQGAPVNDVQALTTLAQALGQEPQAADVFSGSPQPTQVDVIITSTSIPASPTPTATATPFATATAFVPPASPTPIGTGTFDLFEREEDCLVNRAPIVEVVVADAEENGIPNIEVLVRWEGGSERFFTGLKPQIDLGFADYIMPVERTYTLELVGLSDPVAGLTSFDCTTENGEQGSPFYRLLFLPTGTQLPEDAP